MPAADELDRVLADPAGRDDGVTAVDGVLFDLGVSSMQLDQRNRGFAYSVDAPLDMRMNPDDPITAADVLNTYDHGDLARVLADYGEGAIRRPNRLGGGGRAPYSAIHDERAARRPAVRDYPGRDASDQWTPGEAHLSGAADRGQRRAGLSARSPAGHTRRDRGGGRVVVMSYQSLEDRIVKREFAQRCRSSSPAGLPVELPGLHRDSRSSRAVPSRRPMTRSRPTCGRRRHAFVPSSESPRRGRRGVMRNKRGDQADAENQTGALALLDPPTRRRQTAGAQQRPNRSRAAPTRRRSALGPPGREERAAHHPKNGACGRRGAVSSSRCARHHSSCR